MRLINNTKTTTISEQVIEKKAFLAKALGMHADKNANCLYFRTRFGIHTFFLKEAVGVIVTDDSLTAFVVKILKPNKILIWNPKASHVFEVKPAALTTSLTEVGDKLKLEN